MDLRRFSLARVTPVKSPAIMTLAEAKAHLRVDVTDDDTLISALVDAATGAVESYLHRALIRQTWRCSLDRFPYPYPSLAGYVDPLFIQTPTAGGWLAEPIRLPRPNLLSVASVKYLDLAGSQQTLSTSVYTVSTDELPGTISLAYGQSWPNALYLRNSIQVTYDAGYGNDVTAVPPEIIAAAQLVLSDLYTNREAQIVGTITAENRAVEALLGPYVFREAA